MTDCALVTVEVLDGQSGILTVEVLDSDSPQLQVDLQSSPAVVDILVGGVGGAGNAGPPGERGEDGKDGESGEDGKDGRSFNWRGDYDAASEYATDDVVFHKSSSWICLQPGINHPPPDLPENSNGYWQLMAKRGDDGGGGTDIATVQAIASGSTLGLQQELLADDGQPAKTILAVGATNTGRVQGVSLGAGNVVEVFASGEAFQTGTVLFREFMDFGEPICFTGLSDGALITSTQGFYGVSEQVNLDEGEYGPMPLFSYGLSFDFSFLYGFREFGLNEGLIHVVNGPLRNAISLTLGDGTIVRDQQDIALDPWEKITLTGDGDQEYILRGTNRMMAGLQASMTIPHIKDNRLVMPLTNDGITWPREGYVSAPFAITLVDFYVRDGASGSLNSGLGVSPGAPVDIGSDPPLGTGANDWRYRPDGATRFRAKGLMSAFSGADGKGKEATAMMPVTAMAQVTAQPFHIADEGHGGKSGIALASSDECEAKVYEYNPASGELVLKYDVSLTRNSVVLDTPEKQFHPAAAAVSNDVSQGATELDGPLGPGVIVSTSPIMAIVQNGQVDLQPEIRSQNGAVTTSIITQEDETLMLGWTPAPLKAEITTDANGFLRRRFLDGAGNDRWVLT